MSDLEKFIGERKARCPQAWANFEDKYLKFAGGMLTAEGRKNPGSPDDPESKKWPRSGQALFLRESRKSRKPLV
jgi:hypothetical protein